MVWLPAGAAVSFVAQPTRLTAAVTATRAEAMRMILTKILLFWDVVERLLAFNVPNAVDRPG
jgi:hypothetical protein